MRLYRLLLLAFPRDLRREFGADMERMFTEQLLDARRRGESRTRLWVMAAADAVSQGFAERVSRFEHSRSAVRAGARRCRWWMSAVFQDLRYASRLFTRQSPTTIVAVLTLALGIGATTAVYSAVDRLLLRPLPFPDPHELVMVWEKRPAEGVFDNSVAPADFLDWDRMNRVFTSMASRLATSAPWESNSWTDGCSRNRMTQERRASRL